MHVYFHINEGTSTIQTAMNACLCIVQMVGHKPCAAPVLRIALFRLQKYILNFFTTSTYKPNINALKLETTDNQYLFPGLRGKKYKSFEKIRCNCVVFVKNNLTLQRKARQQDGQANLPDLVQTYISPAIPLNPETL